MTFAPIPRSELSVTPQPNGRPLASTKWVWRADGVPAIGVELVSNSLCWPVHSGHSALDQLQGRCFVHTGAERR